ncbi:MAG: hypothetical protein HY075_16415 [Deltaproteobacteria bacterium]|nr:hypothetical protein [Deltaproteobacteria bacterium]
MFLQILMGLVFLGLVAAQAFAGGPVPMEHFYSGVAKRTGLSIEEVREYAIESIRETGNYTHEELERIGKGEFELLPQTKRNELIKLIQHSATFRVRTGLEGIRIAEIETGAGREFDTYRSNPEGSFRHAMSFVEASHLKLEANMMLIEALGKRARAGDEAAKKRLEQAHKDQVALHNEIRENANQLYFATTAFLSSRKIPFRMQAVNGRALIVILRESASPELQRELDYELGQQLAHDQEIIRRPAIVIDANMIPETSLLVREASLFFLGKDFLRRIK